MSVFIIAEAGVNHNGSVELARKMVDVAKDCGASAVKFQTFKANSIASRFAKKAEYQQETTQRDESQLDMLRRLELSKEAHIELIEYCKKIGIMFLSTPFDLGSVDLLAGLGMEIFKIPSGEITNLPYLRKVGSLKKEVILSTGMADLKEVGDALKVFTSSGTKRDKITILQANTEYPTPFEDVNLRAMLTIQQTFGVRVGYSDHTPGIEAAIAATALGASVIEKHFTLDKKMEGPDHKASLEPHELKAMVSAIRNIELALGDGIKKPSPSETKNIIIARKSIVASRDIKIGEKFSVENLTVKRPADGVSPMRWDDIIGRTAKKDFMEDEPIEI